MKKWTRIIIADEEQNIVDENTLWYFATFKVKDTETTMVKMLWRRGQESSELTKNETRIKIRSDILLPCRQKKWI